MLLYHGDLCSVAQSCLTLCDLMDYSPPASSIRGASPGKTTGVGCHAFLQEIFPTQAGKDTKMKSQKPQVWTGNSSLTGPFSLTGIPWLKCHMPSRVDVTRKGHPQLSVTQKQQVNIKAALGLC